ncbi:MAG TPA: PAS domain-containing protein [Dongiaceae bacterium]
METTDLQAALAEALAKTASRDLRIVSHIDEAVQLGIDGEFWDLVLIACPNSHDFENIRRARHEVGLSRAALLALVQRPEDLRAAINAGADDALTLPLDGETIALHIDQALEHRSLRNAVDHYWISTAQEHELDLARFLVDVAPDALLLLDTDGTVQAANSTAARLFCCEAGMLIGSPIGAFLEGLSYRPNQQARIQRLLDHVAIPDSAPVDTVLHRLDGKTLPVEVFGRVVTRLGQPALSIAVRDISKRGTIVNQAPGVESELDRHATTLRQLAQMGAELLAPLEDIANRADVIRLEALGPIGVPLYQTYAADIQRNSRAILKLVERLLSMTALQLPHD